MSSCSFSGWQQGEWADPEDGALQGKSFNFPGSQFFSSNEWLRGSHETAVSENRVHLLKYVRNHFIVITYLEVLGRFGTLFK